MVFYVGTQVGSTLLEEWGSQRYPDFVAEGSGDQKAIMGAICAVKKASFDGVDCVGGDDAATGTVSEGFCSMIDVEGRTNCMVLDLVEPEGIMNAMHEFFLFGFLVQWLSGASAGLDGLASTMAHYGDR